MILMRKVANKRTIRRIALRMLLQNKKKHIAVIASVILTAMLFTVLFSVGISMIRTTQRATMRQVGGSYMAGLKYAREEDYERLRRDRGIKNISYRVFVGMLEDERLKDLVNEVGYATDENARCSFSYPSVGSMPQAKNEIVLSTVTLKKLGLSEKLGQEIPLRIRIGDEVILDTFVLSGIFEGDVVAMSQMAYVSREYQEATAPEPADSYYRARAGEYAGYREVDFDFYHSYQIERQTRALLTRNGYDPDSVDYGINWAYMGANVDGTTLALCIVILLLILAAGYLIIYNIFYIRICADINEYGLLKTIGTSGRQLRKLVKMQADILALVGILAGLLLGTLLARVIFPIVLESSTLDPADMVFSVHPIIYLAAAAFSYLTVLMGCGRSRRIAGRVSPIAAVRYTETDRIVRKRKRTGRVTILSLAIENLRREKKKTMIVMLSFLLSILLMNGLYAFIAGFDADQYVSGSIIGDFIVSDAALNNTMLHLTEESVVGAADIAYLEGIEGVGRLSNVYCDMYAQTNMTEQAEAKIHGLFQNAPEYMKEEEAFYTADRAMACKFYGVDDLPLEYMKLTEGKPDQTLWETGDYAICFCRQLVDRTQEGKDAGFFGVGDEVTVTLQNGKQKTYKIMAQGAMPYALSTKSYSMLECEIIVPSFAYLQQEESAGALVSVLETKEDAGDAVEEAIRRYVQRTESLTYVSKQTYLEEFDRFVLSVKLIGGGLAFVLAVIGVMNFANSMITGIWKRARELSMMQAVGLTGRQMTGMLILEGALQGVLTLLLSVLVWCVLGGALLRALAGEIWFFRYQFTVAPILTCLPFLLIIVTVIPFGACRSMQRRSIVERMRIE